MVQLYYLVDFGSFSYTFLLLVLYNKRPFFRIISLEGTCVGGVAKTLSEFESFFVGIVRC